MHKKSHSFPCPDCGGRNFGPKRVCKDCTGGTALTLLIPFKIILAHMH